MKLATTIRGGPAPRATRRPPGRLDSQRRWNGRRGRACGLDGSRLTRTAPDGTTTVYLPNTELQIKNQVVVGATRFYTVEGSTVALRTAAGGYTHLLANNQGSETLAIDDVSRSATMPRYLPFGGHRDSLFTTPGIGTDHGFLGKPEDATGLDDLTNRYYDAAIGRFIAPDPLSNLKDPQSLNPYSYGLNNPARYTDPSGLLALAPSDGGRAGKHEAAKEIALYAARLAHAQEIARRNAYLNMLDQMKASSFGLEDLNVGLNGLENYGASLDNAVIGLANIVNPVHDIPKFPTPHPEQIYGPSSALGGMTGEALITVALGEAGKFLRLLRAGAAAEAGTAVLRPGSLADEVANATGGVLKTNKGGYTVEVPYGNRGITVRVMEQGGGRTNYYRVSVPGKATYTVTGEASTDAALTHIDIGASSLDDILSIIARIQGGG